MGFFDIIKKVGHAITHPIEAVEAVEKTISQGEKAVEKTIVKGAKAVAKGGEAILHETSKGIDFVESHAKAIKNIVNITADVVEVIGVATGQPEIVAGAEALKRGADFVLDLADKAKKAQTVAEKVVLVAKVISEKKKLSVIVKKTGDAMISAGQASGNSNLEKIGNSIQKGSKVIDKAVTHTKEIHSALKQGIEAAKNKDISGVITAGTKGVKAGTSLKKDIGNIKDIYKDANKSPPKSEKPTSKTLSSADKKQRTKDWNEFVGDQFGKGNAPKGEREIFNNFWNKRHNKIEPKKPKKKPKSEPKKPKKKPKSEKPIKSTISQKSKPKKKKSKRAPSAYNIFVGKHIKAGGTFRSAVDAWNASKK